MNGLVLVDKPSGCTSHDVVSRWRKLANTKRAGHLGTLDPMATGLLALMTGNATRLAQYFRLEEKTYAAGITFGITSDTYDAQGTLAEVDGPMPSELEVLAAMDGFRGTIWQTPPAISAKKIGGVRAYALARRNEPVDLPPVQVTIKSLEITSRSANGVDILVSCSSGTYIRSIAHDLGQMLGCGGILSRLRRTHIGDFDLQKAHTLDELADLAADGRLDQAVLPSSSLLPQMPAEYVNVTTEFHIRQGRDFRTSPFVVVPGTPYVKAVSRSGELIAIGELRIPNVYHPTTVL